MDKLYLNLLKELSALPHENMAHSLRINGKGEKLNSTKNIIITKKTEKSGIDIHIKETTKNESMHIPVIISESGLTDLVYNDFYIEKNAEVTIVAGCAIHNAGDKTSSHNGIHTFHVGSGAKVKYYEKHYGEGSADRILDPVTNIFLEEGSEFYINSSQIKGVSNTVRTTNCILHAGATLVVNEKIYTNQNQSGISIFKIQLVGNGSSAHITSRSVAEDNSTQTFESEIIGSAECFGHVECDAIISGKAKVVARPAVVAQTPDARLIHEAAIGKIAGEQLVKLTSLGLTEKEAEEIIIAGFLK